MIKVVLTVAIFIVTTVSVIAPVAAQTPVGWSDKGSCTVERIGLIGTKVFVRGQSDGTVELILANDAWRPKEGRYSLEVQLGNIRVADSWAFGRDPLGLRLSWPGLAEGLQQNDKLRVSSDDTKAEIDLTGASGIVAAVQSCAARIAVNNGPEFAEEPAPEEELGQSLADDIGEIINSQKASFQCLFGSNDMYGIADLSGGHEPPASYRLDIAENGSLRIDDREVKTLPMYNEQLPTLLDGVAADVRDLQAAMAARNSELPATFGESGKDFPAIMDWYSGLTSNAILGDRKRYLIIFMETGSIGFADSLPNGEVTNIIQPLCYRLN